MIKDTWDKNENASANKKEIMVLKEHFPACFKEDGSFDLERFKEYLSEDINVVNEGYELKFLGKNYARLLVTLETETVIVPNEEHNQKDENKDSENIYISGDNLDGLKHLLKSYGGKVKCIYIDPPYNTGSDGFVYNDNFNFSVEELTKRLSINEEQAKRILDLTKRGSASHSAWLMFMYPRLQLAKDLLSDDGVIFISIDDNEQANLKLLCDDIFDEQNYVSELTWEKKKKGSYLATGITNIKENILVYAKSKSQFKGLIGEVNRSTETYPCINATNKRDIRIIPPGIESKYNKKNFILKKGEVISDTTMNLVLHSDLVIENGILKEELHIEGNWRYGQDAMHEYALNNELYITRDLYLRRIVNMPRYKGLKDLLLRVGEEKGNSYSYEFDYDNLQASGWGSNEDADEEQRLLLGEQSLMSYPKPVLLIMKLLATLHEKDMLVCDFFSGSATTAEAVLRSNVNGKNFKYIMVQLAENLQKRYEETSGDEKSNIAKLIKFLEENNRKYTLDEIGIERIIRASDKIKEEYPDTNIDLGFQHYTLLEPTNETINKLVEFTPKKDEMIINNTILDEFGVPAVITTWLNNDGYGLTSEAEKIMFAGYQAYYKDKHLYLVHPELPNESIEEIVVKYETNGNFNPENIVLFGYSFTWTELESLKTNLKRLQDTEKNLRINFDVRY
ncbi:site-specific DNA-methyltransferase [Listeria monocytogenes]|uniref:site-specific DNA-methyltransferase n=1 Tax=Listeria monocytogenes TaxID=1639 RepID=UPI0008752B12|nr:site-specific DNA-methyltransferase [Listeria monocytogenes]EAE6153067.1 site-specific DNA-methyltransferase [Listeria monocytogenes serotype 1/2a]EAC4011618.1 site-specific DNA-methyltransferase [Listeria monocytogenes]EAC5125930.1 site-specific DNA-methyltransferase [Listeria monocytogenes]EAC6721262.1 site-specific DNA-methyltransferase [Listeria monocytogenes]EAD0679016.1 site-specific DNA-methyltransferase [Listeria monocytogenes]